MISLKQRFCRHDLEFVKVSVSKCVDFETKTTTCTKRCKKCGLIMSYVKLDAPKAKRVENLED